MREYKNVLIFFFLSFFAFPPPLLSFSEKETQKATLMDFKITTYLASGGTNKSQAKITRWNKFVRFESIPEGEEFQIFDYENLIFYRVFPKENIYFSHIINQRELSRAYQQGILLANRPSPLQVQKIKIKETSIKNQAVTLYMVGKKTLEKQGENGAPPLHYSFVWEAKGLGNIPIRIADTRNDGTTTIIDFSNIRHEEVEPSLFQPPEDYLHLSPF